MVYVVFMAEHGRVQGSRQKRLWPSANFQNPFCTSEEPYFKLEFCFGNTNARLQALQLVHMKVSTCEHHLVLAKIKDGQGPVTTHRDDALLSVMRCHV